MARRIITFSFPCALLAIGLAGCQERATVLSSSPAAPSSPTTVSTSTLPARSAVQLEGALSSLAGSCPAVTFTVDNTTVSTTESTNFDGGACAQLMNGVLVAVDGTLSNGSVVAVRVRSEAPHDVVQLRGAVSGVQGACPAVTFTVDNTTVSTMPSTDFEGGSCAQLANGTLVVVDGALQNGSVVAADLLQRR